MGKTKTMVCAAAAALALASCGTHKPVAAEPAAATTPVAAPATAAEVTAYAAASTEFATVKEAADVVLGRSDLKTLAARYGYKRVDGYAVYRLDSYDTMLYRNCQPAKKVGKAVYADLPQPLRKGTSSYVAVSSDVTIGVFNDKAYANLLEQVEAGGFRLVEKGYEDRYTNGRVDVYCYASRRTVRITKTDNQ